MIISELFIYKFVFVIEILVSLHLFSFRQKKKPYYFGKLFASVLICLAVALAFPILSYNSFYLSFLFFALFFLCASTLFLLYKISWQKLFYIAVIAYTTQHFAHEAFSLLTHSFGMITSSTLGMYGSNAVNFSNLGKQEIFASLIYVDCYLVVYWAVYAILGKKINDKDIKINNFSIVVIATIILVTEIIINAIVVYIKEGYNQIYSIINCVYNLICCMMIFHMLHSLIHTKKLENDLETTLRLLQQSEEQYRTSKENIDLINLKCHDLKHQIHEYGNKGNISPDTLKELENIINIYDSTIKTGNDAIDLILTEKSLLCQKHKIRLTALADCSKIQFISESDLYSLFGNLIDNSIEAVTQLKDNEMRNIHLIVRNINSFVNIIVENYYKGKIELDANRLPITTKKDRNNHGFGMKSIKMLVDRYNGDLNISIEKDVFTISILFPISKA